MNNANYWRGRFSVLADAAQHKADLCVSDLEEMYREAEQTVQKDVEAWYARFAANNGLSLSDARKTLTIGQMEEFRWSVEKYIQVGQQANLSPEWLKKLENASARFHVSRLEAVQIQIQQQMELLFSNQVDSIDNLLKRVIANGYIRTAFEVQKGIGLGWDIAALDQKKLETLLSKPWTADHKTFRDRCWDGKANLVSGLQTDLTQGLLRGDSPQRITDAVKRRFNVSRYQAGRLVHTETTYFNAVSACESYKELGVNKVEIIETLDSHTCELCGPLDGTVIPLSQFEPGVTVPPFHPNCRGTTAPAVDEAILGERAARDQDGKVYHVPSNMKFTNWKQTFVQGGSKVGLRAYRLLQNSIKDDNIPCMDITKAWVQKKGTPGIVRDRDDFTVDGVTYKVDGNHVLFCPSNRERAVADVLSQKYGKQLDLLPQVSFPQGIQLPDYLIDGERFDLKSPTGQGKNLLFSMVSKKKKQAPNFIFDITNCPLPEEEIKKQVQGLFTSRHTRFMEKIVVLKGDQIVVVYKRK